MTWLPPVDSALPAPPAEIYQKSLNADLNACLSLSSVNDSQKKAVVINSITQDLNIKDADCQTSGMSRTLSVQVSTMRQGKAENGWLVSYQWEPACSLTTDVMDIPMLTSPAKIDLPPGVYAFSGRKSDPSGKIQTIPQSKYNVTSSSNLLKVELPIP
jgi:hypothetical protein